MKFLQGEIGYRLIPYTILVYFFGDAMGVSMVLAAVVMSLLYLLVERRSFLRVILFLSGLALLIYFSFNVKFFNNGQVQAIDLPWKIFETIRRVSEKASHFI